MAPRNTKHGASANAKRTSPRSPRASATPAKKKTASTRGKKAATRAASTPARKRNDAPPVSRWWAFSLTVVCAIALFAWMYYPAAAVQYRETRERARLAAELEALQARNDRLRKQVDRLKTPAGVEDYARSQLGLVKKGENVVVVVDGDEAAEASAAAQAPRIDSDETTSAPAGAWTAFLDLVFGVQ